MDASGTVFGYQISVSSAAISTTGFTYTLATQGTVWVIGLYWFAFLDENIYTQVSLYGSPQTTFTIPFNTILSVIPAAYVSLSGIEFSAGGAGPNTNYALTVGAITTAGVSVTLTPTAGTVINQIIFSIIYANPMYLTAGYLAYSVNTPTLSFTTYSIFTPLPNLATKYMGIGLIAFDVYINARFETLLSSTTGSIVAYSWGGSYTNSFAVSYFQYQPCPLYCTSCTSGFLVCVSCIATTLRTSADCTTCTDQYYPIAGQLNCAACLSICNLCSGTASNCLGCYGGRTNAPSCNTCITTNMFIQVGLVACQSCASYCNGCINASTSCSACLASTGRLTSPNCTTCPATKFIISGVDNCQSCNSNCDSCVNLASQCLSCSISSQTLIIPNCLTCPTQMFLLALSCQACSTLCNNCSITSTNCLACVPSTMRLNPPNCITCPINMFIQVGQANCQTCNPLCNQCTILQNNCTACNGLYRTNAPYCNQCSQLNYYVDSSQNDCQPCASQCNGCTTSSTNCIACWHFNLSKIAPLCVDCPSTSFITNPAYCFNNILTLYCNSAYNRDGNCNCLSGYFNIQSQLACLKCSSLCQTCTISEFNCLNCNPSLKVFNAPSCSTCQGGYFRQYQVCSQCSSVCNTCVTSETNCTTCQSPKINPPNCNCPNGYFNNCTQSCNITCQTCQVTASNCLTCAGNRINPPFCDCPDGSVQSQAICSSCTTVVPVAIFNNDLTEIAISFAYKLNQIVNCALLFTSATQIQFGLNFQCQIQLNVLIVTLGTDSTVAISQPLFINANQLQFEMCKVQIDTIVTPLVQIPRILNPPRIVFNNQIFTTTPCDHVLITIINNEFNGQRKLQLLGWSIQANTSFLLQNLIDQWNQLGLQNSYLIESRYFKNQVSFSLLISYSNFIGQSSSSLIQVIVQPASLQLYVQVPSSAYVFDIVQIIVMPQLSVCGQNNVNATIQVSVVIQNSTYSMQYNYSLQSENQKIITFNPFELIMLTPYQVIVIATWKSLIMSSQSSFQIQQFPIKVLIQGGDQQIGINQMMNLTAWIFNPNNQTSYIDSSLYQILWKCQNILTKQSCVNFEYIELSATLNTSNYQIYSSLQISIQVIQGQQIAPNNITLTILEGNFIPIQMSGNQHQLNSPMNTYDEVDFKNEFLQPIQFDSDQLTYQGTYVDSTYGLNQIQFNFIASSIIINNFIRGQIIQNVKFRVTIKNKLLSSTSVASQNIFINIPPQECQISVLPRGSRFIIQVTSCISKSQQLQYKLLYYSSKDSFIEDSTQGYISKGLVLKEFQINPTFLLYLSGSNSLLVCIIKDSYNAQSNSSISLKGLQLIDMNVFREMLQNFQNPQINILFILIHLSTNNLTLNTMFFNVIETASNNLNQSDPLTWQIQQLLSTQQSPTSNQITDRSSVANSYINNLSSKVASIQAQQNSGIYNKDYQIQLNEWNFQLSAAAGYVSNLYEISQKQRTRRILEFTAYDNVTQNITHYVTQAVSNLTDIIDKLVKVNQNSKTISTTQFNFSAQKFSTLKINNNFGIQILNQSNQTASYKIQQFKVNPYQNYSDFINPVKSQYIVPNLTDHNSVQIEPSNAIPFSFPIIGNISIQCASRIGNSWSLDVCAVVQSIPIQCLCQKLSPLSIVEALEFILSQFALLFRYQIITKIDQFLYQDTLFTYIITVFIILFIASKFILSKIDMLDIRSVYPAALQESPVLNSAGELDNLKKVDEGILINSTTTHKQLYKPESLLGQLAEGKISKKTGYLKFLQNSHVIFELYFRFDIDDPRILRLSILFLQQFGQISIFVLFGKNLAISIIIGLSILQTVYGVLFQLILSKMLKSKNRIIRSLGIGVAIVLTGFCTYLTVASMSLYSSSYQANIAALSYLASFVADYFVSNLIVELIKYIFISRTCNEESFYKLFSLIISPGLQEIVFGRKLAPPEKQA